MWDYTKKVKDHFLNPRNAGDMENPDAVGEAGSLACGDQMKLMLRIDDREVITDAKFQTFGCGSAVASASALTEMIIGKKISESSKITNRDIADYLGGLPDKKMHCSVLGQAALDAAIKNYRGSESEATGESEKNIVCECFGITEDEIVRVVKENSLTRVDDVTNYTKAGGGCNSCHDKIRQLIEKVSGEAGAQEKSAVTGKKLTTLQKIKLIEETLEKEIRPMLKADGGDVELIDVDGDKVVISLRGMCSSCKTSKFTLKNFIEPKLKEFVSEDVYIEEVK